MKSHPKIGKLYWWNTPRGEFIAKIIAEISAKEPGSSAAMPEARSESGPDDPQRFRVQIETGVNKKQVGIARLRELRELYPVQAVYDAFESNGLVLPT